MIKDPLGCFLLMILLWQPGCARAALAVVAVTAIRYCALCNVLALRIISCSFGVGMAFSAAWRCRSSWCDSTSAGTALWAGGRFTIDFSHALLEFMHSLLLGCTIGRANACAVCCGDRYQSRLASSPALM